MTMSEMEWKKVCCPVDFSEPSRAALRVAADMCQRFGAELTLLHVADAAELPGCDLKLREWGSAAEKSGISLRTAHAVGDPQLAIVDFARQGGFQLIVMGTHGRTGRDHAFAGSVAESVVRRAACPVLTVR
jgi:universal stress protein A